MNKCQSCGSSEQVQVLFLNQEQSKRLGLGKSGSAKLCKICRAKALKREQRPLEQCQRLLSSKEKEVIPRSITNMPRVSRVIKFIC